MDLGFCFQDLGDGGDSFIKSFIEPSGHAYQDAMLEDLASSHGSGGLGLAEDGGWADDSAYLLGGASYPSASFSSSWNGLSAHHTTTTAYNHHTQQQQQQQQQFSYVASSPSASSSPSGRSSPSSSSIMALADYEEAAHLSSLGGSGSMLTMAMPPLVGLSYFDLQAGAMEMPDALGLYGLGGPFAATTALDPLPPPPARARPSSSSTSHLLGSVKLEHAYQQQLQQGTPSSSMFPSTSAPSKVGAGVPGMWSPPHDEPVKRKRKLGAAARRPPGASAPASASSGSVDGPSAGKTSDPYELPLAVELAGALSGHRGVSIKLEERPEAGVGKHSHRQQQQQQQQQTAGNRQSEPVELVVERQPPVEVRTRTPSENRNFGVTVRITGHHGSLSIHAVEVRLAYASSREEVNQQILGGKKTVPLKEDGRATFDNLSMREASTKHGEREFCLEFVPLSKEDQPLGSFGTRTSPFYAYSHMKVLARRKSVKLRTLNKSHGSVHGGDKMHVIGQPFIKGPSLSIIFSTPHGDVTALNPEMYSDSVLFFEAPPYPCPAIFSPYSRDHVREVKVMVQVTNDGRTMSNPLEFTYIADKPVHRADF